FECKTWGKPIRLEGTDHEHIAVCFQDILNRQIRLPAFPNDLEIGTLAQTSNQRLRKQTVFDYQKQPHRFTGYRFVHKDPRSLLQRVSPTQQTTDAKTLTTTGTQ